MIPEGAAGRGRVAFSSVSAPHCAAFSAVPFLLSGVLKWQTRQTRSSPIHPRVSPTRMSTSFLPSSINVSSPLLSAPSSPTSPLLPGCAFLSSPPARPPGSSRGSGAARCATARGVAGRPPGRGPQAPGWARSRPSRWRAWPPSAARCPRPSRARARVISQQRARQSSEVGRMRLETLIELKFLNSSFSSSFSYRNLTMNYRSSNSSKGHRQQSGGTTCLTLLIV